MAGPWDSVAKRMIGANPEHFVKWLASEATFVAALDIELKSQHIYADALLKVVKEEKPGLLHEEIHRFYYRVIRLWLIPAEVILQPGQMGLLPLVILTEGGKQPEVVNEMV